MDRETIQNRVRLWFDTSGSHFRAHSSTVVQDIEILCNKAYQAGVEDGRIEGAKEARRSSSAASTAIAKLQDPVEDPVEPKTKVELAPADPSEFKLGELAEEA